MGEPPFLPLCLRSCYHGRVIIHLPELPIVCRVVVVLAWLLGSWCGVADAHQAPVNVFVDSATNRLFTLPNFAAGRLSLDPGVKISTTTPGIGISFPSNGVSFGTRLMVDAFPGLYYWNGGGSLSPTPETLTWDPPVRDVLGNLTFATGHYDFREGSGEQLGMTWATYVDTFFWEADGFHQLTSLAAAPGVYGTVIRLRSDRNLASLPFVVPYIYDPHDDWDFAAEEYGVSVMRALARTSMPGDFDGDQDFDCGDVDALVAQIASGLYDARYDRTGDGLLDDADLTQWLTDAATHNLLPGQSYRPGDANLDGNVDGSDFGLWNMHKFSATAAWCQGDFNADGTTDGSDFNLWNGQKFTGSASVVPEPWPGGCSSCWASEGRKWVGATTDPGPATRCQEKFRLPLVAGVQAECRTEIIPAKNVTGFFTPSYNQSSPHVARARAGTLRRVKSDPD